MPPQPRAPRQPPDAAPAQPTGAAVSIRPSPLQLLNELAKSDPGSRLDQDQVARLAEVADVQIFAPGELLFSEGDPSDAVYLVVSGEVEFTQAGSENLQLMPRGYGEFVGEMGVIENQPRSATGRARGPVQVLRFTNNAFLELIRTAPFLIWKLMRNISFALRHREQEYMERLQLRNKELAEAAARLQNMNNVLEQLVADRTRELAAANERLEALAVTDEVTGLYNRRFLQQTLERKVAAVPEVAHPFTVIMVDIDNFKHYNDRNGHLAGDGVLRKVGELLRQVIRGGDIIARYGGEEFCIVLENVAKPASLRVAEKLRRAVMEHEFPKGYLQPLGALTISLGVAAYPEDAAEVMTVLDKADQALYLAKNNGRNQVATVDAASGSRRDD
ncbi:MAG TPA: GGDEF domain-containing protein [Chloroflexia bacterium]|nr:GGDEF domain-containing protein [Chloroflexia bacterium]